MTGGQGGPTPADFDAWNIQKQAIHAAARWPIFREGQVWWCALGVNVGSEVYGKGPQRTRPVIVLRKLSRESCIVVPVTSVQPTRLSDWYHPIGPCLIKSGWSALAASGRGWLTFQNQISGH
jgi:PemK-like, MazF-like toxin of type II toxin-antitoxin system